MVKLAFYVILLKISDKANGPTLNCVSLELVYLSGGFSLGWPVAGRCSVTYPDQFGMFGTLDPNVLHTQKVLDSKQ